jgi:uroporphyrinogen III methyltransferase/synthase
MTVLLVGAGPGDPDLLTLRAEAALAAADLVVADATLVPLAAAFAPGADVVPAPADPRALAALVARAAVPVRLYRGDPWLHPAFAAESAALASGGVACEAVPGPPVEIARAGSAGVPLHHRPLAVTLTLGPLPAVAEPARTLAAEVPDLAAACAALAPGGARAAAVPAGGAARRGTLADLGADPALTGVPGVLVTGATTSADAQGAG